MPNEKTRVDQWVRREIENLSIRYTEQTSDVTEIKNALKNASKQGGTGSGKPEFVFLVNDTVIIVEDKPNTSQLELLTDTGEIDLTVPNATANYAVNGAVHYAKHIVEKSTNFKDAIAIGATGSTDARGVVAYHIQNEEAQTSIKRLGLFSDWGVLSPINFDEWYGVNVLGNLSKDQKDELELKKIAAQLHEDLRNFASLEGENKATVISAILLALNEPSFNIENLIGRKKPTDGRVIYRAIEDYMSENEISPEFKVEVVMNKFRFIQTNVALNEKRSDLGMTPLRYFASILQKDVLDHFKNNTEFDILGNFYGEFVKYGDSDGNGLGIVLTPKHITSLMAELIQIGRTDYVLDPTAGSGAFLISAMNRMLNDPLQEGSQNTDTYIKQHQLFGIEMQEKMYTVATTNMILRGDGKSNLMLASMLNKTSDDFISNGNNVAITKALMNPPYSQGSTTKPDLYEINFINHTLDMVAQNGRLAVIVPQSTMTGKSKIEKEAKDTLLKKHTLDAVITLNSNTFQGQRAGVQPVIALFTAKIPHPSQKQVKFINFKDDGWIVKKHLGLQDDGTAAIKRKKLVDTILYDIPAETSFIVKSAVSYEDEWLHSYFYFNDSLPSSSAFEKTVQDYLSFKFDQIIHGKEYLFEDEVDESKKLVPTLLKLDEVEWGEFEIEQLFDKVSSVKGRAINEYEKGEVPYISTSASNNGLIGYISADRDIISPKNVITIDPIKGKAFYHVYEFVGRGGAGSAVNVLESDKLNARNSLFLTTMIELNTHLKASYGTQLNGKRLRRQKFLLPIKTDGSPDWTYMEQYIVDIMTRIELPEIERLEPCTISLDSVAWKEFSIDSISETIQSGRDWESYNRKRGEHPFIGSSALNNGITDFVDYTNKEKYVGKNVIGINRNGNVGYAFYHPYSAYFSGDTRFIKLKNHANNAFVNLFIITMIMQQKDKYAYGYKMGTKRLTAQKIMLPVNEEGIPDWVFMEKFIKSISNSNLI